MKIYQLCQEHGIWLCEDNCESYGAKMDPRLEDDNGDPDTFEKVHAGDWTNGQEYGAVQAVGSMSTMSVVSVRSEKRAGGSSSAYPNLSRRKPWSRARRGPRWCTASHFGELFD